MMTNRYNQQNYMICMHSELFNKLFNYSKLFGVKIQIIICINLRRFKL